MIDTVETGAAAASRVRVWDRFVRLFHWTVAAAFFVAYLSEGALLEVHVWAGYTIGVLVAMRVVWGFVGPPHARFRDFVCGPWAAWRYLLRLLAFRAPRHLGHSPAGGLMVIALLVGLLATVGSGLELHAIENGAGPLAARSERPPAFAPVPLAAARADEEEPRHRRGRRGGGEVWQEVHEALANVVMVLVILHVAGVLLASVVHRENLVAAMLTGEKRAG